MLVCCIRRPDAKIGAMPDLGHAEAIGEISKQWQDVADGYMRTKYGR